MTVNSYVAILLTVHNRKEKTICCLNEIFNQTLPDGYVVHVYLTNDGCTDGTPEVVRMQFPQVTIIEGDGSLFWNRGMWTAWDHASRQRKYDFYLWLNDDTFLYDNSISKLIISSVSHNNRSIIVGATDSLDHSHTTYGGRDMHGIPSVDGYEKKCVTFSGNIVLVPKFVYEKIGNLDFYYHHSGGDTDYGFSATKNGIDIFQAGEYLGSCDEHPHLSKWCDPAVPLGERWAALYRPNGQPPHELFHLESKFFGLHRACFHYISTHLHCIFPLLWKWIGKEHV